MDARLQDLRFDDLGHGYDCFGASRQGAARGWRLTRFLYERYFRVHSLGIENVPAEGPVIVTANHSGTLPLDAMMLYADLLRNTDPPRLPRPIADHFVASLPVISTLFARGGVVSGARKNVEHLLARGELLLLFPEGTPGIVKPFSQRYRLQRWREGHAELAIRLGAAVVPACVVGAEEQWPRVAKVPLPLFGAPFLPIMATPMPLPVRYHLRYGAPIRFDAEPAQADDPSVVAAAADRVRGAVAALLTETLASREGVFR